MESQQETQNPLKGKEITYIRDWEEWKNIWEEETRAEKLHSLLHFGFDVSADRVDSAERICMYLDMADRSGSSWIFASGPDDDRRIFGFNAFGDNVCTTMGVRQELSRKAYEILCQKLFRNTNDNDAHLYSWFRQVSSSEVLNKILWFFRPTDEGFIENLSLGAAKDHYREIARKFITDLCVLVWDAGRLDCYRGTREIDDNVREIFKETCPETINVLWGLRKLDIFTNKRMIGAVDEVCLKKLKSLVYEEEFYLPQINFYGDERRKPTTMAEACLAGSQAAQVLSLLEIMIKENDQVSQARRLERQRRNAEEQLTKLNRSRKR